MRLAKVAGFGTLATVLLAVTIVAVLDWRRQAHRANWQDLVAYGMTLNPASIVAVMDLPAEIDESSGVATSRRNPGVLWTHNDSGDRARVFGLLPGRGLIATIRLANAPAADWEDIAVGPCPWDLGTSCVFVGDIGDNFRVRSSVAVIVFEEPDLDVRKDAHFESNWSVATLRYPARAENAEGLAVTESGDLLIVTKHDGVPAQVFRVPRAELADALQGPPGLMQPHGTIEVRWNSFVTAATWSKRGELVVRTYYEVFFWRREGDGWSQSRPPCFIGHAGPAGEGLEEARDGVLYLSREATREAPPTLHLAVCPV